MNKNLLSLLFRRNYLKSRHEIRQLRLLWLWSFPITISIKPEGNNEKRGPGYWKFNHSFLESEDFITKWALLLNMQPENTRILWTEDFVGKCWKWRFGCLQFVTLRRKPTESRNIELDFHQNLEKIKLAYWCDPWKFFPCKRGQATKTWTRWNCRARWYEVGEKCNKYFFNLEEDIYQN